MDFQGVCTVLGALALCQGGFSGAWSQTYLILLTGNVTPDVLTQLSQLTECGFTGYTRKAIVWGLPNIDQATALATVVDTFSGQWQGPSDASGQTVTGWAVIGPANPLIPSSGSGGSAGPVGGYDVYQVGVLETDVPLHLPTDVLALLVGATAAGGGGVDVA